MNRPANQTIPNSGKRCVFSPESSRGGDIECRAWDAGIGPSVLRTEACARRKAVVSRQPPGRRRYVAAACWYVPFKPFNIWVARNQIFLPVMINGVATLGLMDTGGAASMVTPEVAAAAKLKIADRKEKFVGTTGAFTAQLTKLNRIEIGSINITGHPVYPRLWISGQPWHRYRCAYRLGLARPFRLGHRCAAQKDAAVGNR